MTRVIAVAAMLAGLLATAPAGAESVCIHKDNCHALPGPNLVGGGMTDNYTAVLRVGGAEVIHPTGVKFVSDDPVFGAFAPTQDFRAYGRVNGGTTGVYGYTVILDSNWCGDTSCYLVYVAGQCRMITAHHGYIPTDCAHSPHGP